MQVLRQLSISDIQDEVRALVDRGKLGRRSYIYELCKYFSTTEWDRVERVLEDNDYLLRDCVIDLIGKESWSSDS
jgi:hypothetical protein